MHKSRNRLEVKVPNITQEELEKCEKHPNYYMNGAFGNVQCIQINNMDAAVKRFHNCTSHKILMNFHELNHLAVCDHVNVVKVIGAGPDIYNNKLEYIIMEFADSGSLYQVLHKYQPQPEYNISHVIDWCLQVASGANYLHSRHIIHRDLKPANLLLFERGARLKLCDFGTVKKTDFSINTSEKGTFVYMAPEVMYSNEKNQSHYSEKCDVYSWAIILWELLTRRQPFQTMNACGIVLLVLIKKKRLEDIPDCPPLLDQIIKKAWHTNPAVRPCMGDLIQILSTIKRYLPPAKYPLNLPEDILRRPWLHNNPNHEAAAVPSPLTREMEEIIPQVEGNDNDKASSQDQEIMIALLNEEFLPVTPLDNDEESQNIHAEHQRLLREYCDLQKRVDVSFQQFHDRLTTMASDNKEKERMHAYCLAQIELERLSAQLHPAMNK